MDERSRIIYKKMMDRLTKSLNNYLDGYEELAGKEKRHKIERSSYSDWREAEEKYGEIAMTMPSEGKVPEHISKEMSIRACLIQIAHLNDRIKKVRTYFDIYKVGKRKKLDYYESEFCENMETFLKYEWDPCHFPEIVWNDNQRVLDELRSTVLAGLAANLATNIIAKDMADNTGELLSNCEQYVDNIKNEFISLRDIKSYKRTNCEKYRIIIGYDTKTCRKCQEMEDKVFNCKDAVIGINFPPFHLGCRCCTVPYIDYTEFHYDGEKAARDIRGKSILIPSKMKYKEWKEIYAPAYRITDDDIIEIDFKGVIPYPYVRDKMKAVKYRWNPEIKMWWAYKNTKTLELAIELCGE